MDDTNTTPMTDDQTPGAQDMGMGGGAAAGGVAGDMGTMPMPAPKTPAETGEDVMDAEEEVVKDADGTDA